MCGGACLRSSRRYAWSFHGAWNSLQAILGSSLRHQRPAILVLREFGRSERAWLRCHPKAVPSPNRQGGGPVPLTVANEKHFGKTRNNGVPSRTLTGKLTLRTRLLCALSYGDKESNPWPVSSTDSHRALSKISIEK